MTEHMMNDFRDVERSLCLVKSDVGLRVLDPSGISCANAVLCFGYVDHTAGLTFEVLALALCVGSDYTILPEYDKVALKLRADSIHPADVVPIQNDALMLRYSERIQNLDLYYEDRASVACRAFRELDSYRHPQFPDDIRVTFMDSNHRTEQMWVRAEAFVREDDGLLIFGGVLLNEPVHNPSLHCGDNVIFGTTLTSSGRVCLGIVPR